MGQYNYQKTKKELMEQQLDTELKDPNPLNYSQKLVFKELMFQKFNFYPSDEAVLEIKQFFIDTQIKEVRTVKGDKGLVFVDFKGEVSRFNNYDSRLIEILRELEPELKIRMMSIRGADMETYIANYRIILAKQFDAFFKNKRSEVKETGEKPQWDIYLTDSFEGYNLTKPYTMKKLVSDVKSGKINLENAEKIFDLLNEEVFIRDE